MSRLVLTVVIAALHGCAPTAERRVETHAARDAGRVAARTPDAEARPSCVPAPRCPTRRTSEEARVEDSEEYLRLRALFAGERSRLDIAEVSLLMSRLADPSVDEAADRSRLDRLASEARRQIPRRCTGRCALRSMVRIFLRRWRFHPVDDPNGLYVDPQFDLLHDVLESRAGYCEGLTVAFLAIAQRVGIPVRGVLARQHVYVRYEGEGGVIDVDLTREGRRPLTDRPLPGCHPREGIYGRALSDREMAAQVVSVVGILDAIPARRGWLDVAVALAPNDPDLLNNRGAEREARGDLDGAAADYLSAARLDPCVAFYRVNHAGVLRRAGRLDEAKAALDAVEREVAAGSLEDDPLYTSLARADLALDRGEDALAERYYLRAIAASEGAPVAHEALGRMRLTTGNFRAAAESFLGAVERRPSAAARLLLAEALIRARDDAGPIELARAERDGADEEEVSWLRALIARNSGRAAEVEERATRCLDRVGPPCIEAAVMLGDLTADARCARGWYDLAQRCPAVASVRERARVVALARSRRIARGLDLSQ